MSLWKYNNVELEVDMEDADFQEKYENAFLRMEQTEVELAKVGNLSQVTRDYCKMFYQLFDDIFGDRIGDKLFNGKHNIRLIDEAYSSFIDHCKKEVDAINKRRANMVSKYKVNKKR